MCRTIQNLSSQDSGFQPFHESFLLNSDKNRRFDPAVFKTATLDHGLQLTQNRNSEITYRQLGQFLIGETKFQLGYSRKCCFSWSCGFFQNLHVQMQ